HTRFSRDWSSDVCSSDLGDVARLVDGGTVSAFDVAGDTIALTRNALDTGNVVYIARAGAEDALRQITQTDGERLPDVRFGGYERSEERRVGKEGGAGGSR